MAQKAEQEKIVEKGRSANYNVARQSNQGSVVMPVEVSEHVKKGTDRVPLLKADSDKMKIAFRLKNPAGAKEIPAN